MKVAFAVVLAGSGCTYTAPPPDRATDGPESDAAALVLIDTGLVVRYFIDEASTGRAPEELLDSTPDPLNLPITYGQAEYVENAGNRGLHWPNALGDGKVEVGMGSPKLASLRLVTTTTTMELVVDVDGADATTDCHIAGLRGLNPDFILSAIGQDELRFHRPFNSLTATWVGVDTRDRMVLHVVYDAFHPDPESRVSLYKNGALVPKSTSNPPPMGESVMLSASTAFMIGNHQDQNQSLGGTVHYVAYYDQTLTPAEISNNAQRLLANDDR